ncbi:HAMP domain-containing histidine kinase [Candidatus Dojkabacteria bacterium]|nr:HAMP domain-containing histidine kinase [Candidatus Dojkabacteria bacterium]
MNISFKKTRIKIALFFSFFSSILLITATILMIFLIESELEKQAMSMLEDSLSTVIEDFQANRLEEKEVKFQASNLMRSNEEVEKDVPNIYDSQELQKKDVALEEKEVMSSEIPEDFKELQENKTVFSRIILANGDIAYSSDLFDSFYIDPQDKGFKKHVQYGTCVYSYTADVTDGENSGSIVQVAQYCAFTIKQRNNILKLMIFVTLISSFATFLLGLLIAKIFMRPLEKSVEQTRAFTRNCYHELLTPITLAMTTADASTRSGRYKDGLFSIKEDLGQCKRALNLLSSNALREQLSLSSEKADVAEILEQVISECKKKHDRKSVRIDAGGEKKKVFKKGNTTAMKMIFKNLIDNALKYSRENSTINVTLNNKEFMVVNTVYSPKDIDIENFFKMTYRGKNARSVQGNGIGLLLVAELAEAHGWSVKALLEGKEVIIRVIW